MSKRVQKLLRVLEKSKGQNKITINILCTGALSCQQSRAKSKLVTRGVVRSRQEGGRVLEGQEDASAQDDNTSGGECVIGCKDCSGYWRILKDRINTG